MDVLRERKREREKERKRENERFVCKVVYMEQFINKKKEQNTKYHGT